MLVHDPEVAVGEWAGRIWYPLWDSGTEIDHSVRTVAEVLAPVAADGTVAVTTTAGTELTVDVVGYSAPSATGRFDDQQLFYLMTRGIPEDEARRLVVRGFFASVVGRIGVPEVQERLMAAIELELSGGAA